MPPDDRDLAPDAEPPLPARGEWEYHDSDTEPDVEPPVLFPQSVFCKRCGETSEPVANCCPWCGAWLVGPRPRATPVHSIDDDEPEDDWHTDVAAAVHAVPVAAPPLVPPLLVVFVTYGLLLASLVMFVIVAVVYNLTDESDMHAGLAIVEAIDAVLTFAALALVWRTARQKLPKGAMAPTWLAAFPILFALLCLNLAYITFLRELFQPFGVQDADKLSLTLVTVLLICVQPAIVEEVFFRQVTLGVLRRSMNIHLAVWLTAAMFAFAHLANPFGMPYLFLAGGAFGYARAYGGLTLAMILHFLHNLAVVAYEVWR